VIRVVLADDHTIVRQGIRALLEAESDIEVIAEAESGPDAVAAVQQYRPDVLLVDMMMPGYNGLEVTHQISQQWPTVRVVILSMHSNEAYVTQALTNGAYGYVLKNAPISDLLMAVRQAAAGQHYLSPPLSDQILQDYLEKTREALHDPYETLTSREREILHLAAEGFSNLKIAEYLSISSRTVEVHRAHLMRKLMLHNQTELIRYALQRGLLSLES